MGGAERAHVLLALAVRPLYLPRVFGEAYEIMVPTGGAIGDGQSPRVTISKVGTKRFSSPIGGDGGRVAK